MTDMVRGCDADAVGRRARPRLDEKAGMHEGALGSAPVSRLARSSVAAFVIYSAGVGLTYCSQLAIARIVGVDTYGVYAYVIAWMTVLAYSSALGFEVALLRFVPAYETERSWELLRGVIQYAQRRSAIVGMAIVTVGICVVLTWVSSPALRSTFLAGFLLVPVLALLWICCSAVRAFGGVVSALVPDRIVRDGVLLALLAVASLGQLWSIDAPFVMAATLIGSVAGLGWAALAMRRLRPHAARDVLPVYDAPTWRRAALPLVIIGAGETVMNRSGVILLGWISDTNDAGIYSLAYNVALVVALPRIAVNTLFAPTVSGLFVRKDRATLQILVASAASWSFCAAAFIGIVLFVAAETFLGWFGPGYEAGAPALRVLLVGQVIVASAGSQLYIMTMTGHERAAARLLVACAAGGSIAGAVLISMFGLAGAAVGTAATLIAWNLAMASFLWRHLRLLPGILALFRLPLAEACSKHEAGPTTTSAPSRVFGR